MPPIATSGMSPIRRFHSRDPLEPLPVPTHRLEDRRIDGTERHVVGAKRQRPVELGLVMGADAEPQAGGADRREVGGIEVLLAEMDEVAALRRWRAASNR